MSTVQLKLLSPSQHQNLFSETTSNTLVISPSLANSNHKNQESSTRLAHSPISNNDAQSNNSNSNNFLSSNINDVVESASNVKNECLSESNNHAAVIAAGIVVPQPIRNNSPYHLRNGKIEDRLHSVLELSNFFKFKKRM